MLFQFKNELRAHYKTIISVRLPPKPQGLLVFVKGNVKKHSLYTSFPAFFFFPPTLQGLCVHIYNAGLLVLHCTKRSKEKWLQGTSHMKEEACGIQG